MITQRAVLMQCTLVVMILIIIIITLYLYRGHGIFISKVYMHVYTHSLLI